MSRPTASFKKHEKVVAKVDGGNFVGKVFSVAYSMRGEKYRYVVQLTNGAMKLVEEHDLRREA